MIDGRATVGVGMAGFIGLLCVLTLIGVSYLDRTRLAGAGFALFLVSSLLVRSFGDIWLGLGWIGLFGGFWLARRKSVGPVFYAGAALLGFHLLAIPGSIIWGAGNWESTTAIVLWMAPSVMLLTTAVPVTFIWLIPVWFIHGTLIAYSAFANWHLSGDGIIVREAMPGGLSHNTNLAAGFLVVGIIYLLADRRLQWFAVPLLLVLPLTGSRWAALVCLCLVIVMALAGRINWRPVVVGACLLVMLLLAVWGYYPTSNYALSGFDSFASLLHPLSNGQVQARLAMPHLPSILPYGVAEHPGLHNVPLRIAVENGILAALVWLAITGWALWPRKGVKQAASEPNHGRRGDRGSTAVSGPSERFPAFWWMLLALALLSLLDYYTWMGHLGGFWWLLVGMRLHRYGKPSSFPDGTSLLTRAAPATPPTVPPR